MSYFGHDTEFAGSVKILPGTQSLPNVLDLMQNEVQNIKLHSLNTTGRPGIPKLGQMYYDIDKERIGVCVDPTNANPELRWHYGADIAEIFAMFENSNTVDFTITNGKVKADVKTKADLQSDTDGLELTNVGIAGEFTKVQVDTKGRVIAGSELEANDLPEHNHTSDDVTDFHTAVRTNKLNQMALPDGVVSFNSQRIVGVALPTGPTDATNKFYVDNLVALGLKPHEPAAKAATTANITLAGEQTIDGVDLVAGDYVLVKNQTAPEQNGVYVVSTTAWGRSSKADTYDEMKGLYIFIENGDINGNSSWYCVASGTGTIGVSPIHFTLFSRAGQIVAGLGLSKTGATIDVNVDNESIEIENDVVKAKIKAGSVLYADSQGLQVLADLDTIINEVYNDENVLRLGFAYRNRSKIFRIVGNGTHNAFACTHNMNSKRLQIAITDANEKHIFTKVVNETNAVTKVYFKNPPANGANYFVSITALYEPGITAIDATGSVV